MHILILIQMPDGKRKKGPSIRVARPTLHIPQALVPRCSGVSGVS